MPSRAELLQHFAEDLARVRPDLEGSIACPRCLLTLPPDDEQWTLEHIVPSAVGGTSTVLTCRACNNTDGYLLDAHFVRMLRAQAWATGDGSFLRGAVRIGDTKLPIHLSMGDPRIIKILGGPPALLKAFKQKARMLGIGSTISMTFSANYIPERATRALVRMGYLALFGHLGYEYVYSSAAEWARSIIDATMTDELWRCTPQLINIEEGSRVPPITVSPVADDQAIIAYLVLLRIEDRQTTHHAVILPAPGIPAPEARHLLDRVIRGLQSKTQTIQVVTEGT